MNDLHIVSASYSKVSRTRDLSHQLRASLDKIGATTKYVDLRDIEFAFCVSDDEGDVKNYPSSIQEIYEDLNQAKSLLLVARVYLYSVSGGAKNFLDMVGDALENKPLALATASGTQRSYLAGSEILNAMRYEYSSIIFPKTLQYSSEDSLSDPSFSKRVDDYCESLFRFVNANENNRELEL